MVITYASSSQLIFSPYMNSAVCCFSRFPFHHSFFFLPLSCPVFFNNSHHCSKVLWFNQSCWHYISYLPVNRLFQWVPPTILCSLAVQSVVSTPNRGNICIWPLRVMEKWGHELGFTHISGPYSSDVGVLHMRYLQGFIFQERVF